MSRVAAWAACLCVAACASGTPVGVSQQSRGPLSGVTRPVVSLPREPGRIAVGDALRVTVYDLDGIGLDWEQELRVDQRGEVTVPRLGAIRVTGHNSVYKQIRGKRNLVSNPKASDLSQCP